MLRLFDFRSKAKGVADLSPYAALVAPGVVLNKDGSFTAAYACQGQDADSAVTAELHAMSGRFNTAAKLLGTGWVMHMDAVRTPYTGFPEPWESAFGDATTRFIESQRRYLLGSGACHVSQTYLSLTYTPDALTARLDRKKAKKKKNGAPVESVALEKELDRFEHTLSEFEEVFSSVMRLSRLGEYYEDDENDTPQHYSALLSHLQACATGVSHPVRVPLTPMYLDALLCSEPLVGGLKPRLGDKHMAVVGVDGLPQESWPTMLSTLETLPLSYRWSTRFIFLDQYDATKEAESYRKGWQQQVFRFLDKFLNNPNARANRDAARMVEDAEEAIADIQGGTVSAGYLTTAIVLLDDDRDTVISHAKSLRGLLRNLGWGCRVESFNAVEAWQGTHPANTWANLRRPLVHTLNLAHMLPLSSVWRGRRHNPCPFYPPASPPLAVVTTDGSTPFYLNLHVGDVAHTLIVGPTGAGKSTLLAFLAYSFMRYAKAQIFAFDTGMSLYALCLAVKGQHYDIGNTDGLAFAPLRQIDTPVDRAWAAEWIAMLCQLQHMEIRPEHTNAIMEGLERLAGNPENMRGLKEFWNLVPDTAIREALQHYTTLGSMGHLLDAQTDTLGLSHFTVFEIEELMNMGNANLLPIITYIFRRIEQALDGRPSLLLLDEAWIMLGHPAFRDKIREWLKVFRKKNCGVVLATQSLSDAKNSGIFDVLVESCPTKILLANPEARQSDQIALYRDLGCNERVIGQIAEATPKREYFAMSPEGRRMFQLALNPEQLAFLGVSDKHSIARIQALHTQYGPDGWQQHWLQERCA